ncbi:MAG: nucleotidyltransferase domain-containing protein [Cyanobacteriota bacterium]
MQPTAEEMAIYRATARKRAQQRRDRLNQRHQLGLSVAQQAAKTLRQDFHAQRVVLFGSMRSPEKVHERSDVDLAVWGLHPRDYFRAVGKLLAIDPDMPIDVIEAESASPRMLAEIAATGVDL